MKTLKVLVSLVFSLLIMSSINAQKPEPKYKIIKHCGVENSIKIWLEYPNPDNFVIDSFRINNGRNYSKYDTAYFKLECGASYYYFQIWSGDKKDYSNLSVIRKCMLNPNIKIGLIDSANQKAQVEFKADETSLNRVELNLEIFQTTLVNGQIVLNSVVNFYEMANNGKLVLNESLDLPIGKYKYIISSSFNNCIVKDSSDFWIGNLNTVKVDKEGFIHDSIYYWHPGGSRYCDIVNWWENQNCMDTTAFFYNPDSNERRRRWYNTKYYKKPSNYESIHYDFNSDGIIDYKIDTANKLNRVWYSRDNKYIKIPEKYNEGLLTVWSRDSLGQWISSSTQYNKCAAFARHAKVEFNESNSELTFSSNGKYDIRDSLFVTIRRMFINGKDTSFEFLDAFSFQANKLVKKTIPFGYTIVERITNKRICDNTIIDTFFTCESFNRKDSVLANNDSIYYLNKYYDRVLIKVHDTSNNWTLVDSVWLDKGENYVKQYKNGVYYVERIYSNNLCSQGILLVINNSSAHNNNWLNQIKVYPNPFTHSVYISLENEIHRATITDLAGKEISQLNLVKGSNQINLESLAKGSYFLNIKTKNGFQMVEKIIKN